MVDRNMVVGVVVGLLVGAGGVLALGLGEGDGDGDAVDMAPVELPDEAGGLVLLNDAIEDFDGDVSEEAVARWERTLERAESIVGEAYGGAAVDVQDYATAELDARLTVVAVRAPSGPVLSSQFTEPGDLGLAAPTEEVIALGEVECLVGRPPVREGDDVASVETFAEYCQRSDAELTVRAFSGGQNDVVVVAAAVEAGWDHIIGGGA